VANKGSRRWRLELKTRPKGSIKAKEMAKEKTRTDTKSKDNRSSTISSMAKRWDMSPEIVQMPRKLRKGSRASQTLNLRCNNPHEK
jgi:hypothetical protein